MPDSNIIETTAGDVAAELSRRGIGPDERLVVFVRRAGWLAEARKESRALATAAGLSDEDIDRMIDEEREEVQHLIK